MLLELSIRNFAIIDDLKINFSKGLNVLTGETGSGKSIIIEALGMVLGGRGTRDLISTGADRAILQAVFVLEDENDSIRSFLDEQGIPIDEDGLLIISREISINSPSISRINDKVVTLTILNKISHRLVDIFAQHEHQSLLNTSNHKTIIDSFGDHKHRNLLDEIASIYQGYKENRQLLSEMDIDVMERERLIDLYRFQIDEIDSLQLTPYDDEEIEDDYRKLSNVMEITQGLGQVVEYFSGDGYDTMSLLDSINKSIALLSNISEYDKDLLPLLDRLREANYELQDLNNEFKYYMDNIQLDEERLNILSERLDLVNRLKKKYGNNVQSILDYRDSTEEALDKLLNHENEIRVLREKLREQEEELYGLSKKLSESRRSLALDLEEAITRELDELNMHNVRFKVDFKESPNLASDGIDKIEFLISTNLGEDLKPMSKIASGGEMSRIMLGFKSILAKYDGIPTLIFDEIDSGISGRTAQVVGEKIHKISKERQVISISHLPQIAAMADSQYSIYKEIKKGRVTTFIKKLDEEERVLELAKLLGGVDLTETTINHAKEMLQMTKKLKMENFNT
ncbi:MAG: DNA repair protein RecN [Tissierellaceae bacterium]|jgi:DNA repair protein RecN (Recombination protein N)|nr:DNA repair protein RecN [Tissierellia bacterium]